MRNDSEKNLWINSKHILYSVTFFPKIHSFMGWCGKIW